MNGIFDSHAHYDDPAFDPDREEVLSSLQQAGVARFVDVGASVPSTKRALALAAQYDFAYASVGIHPTELYDEGKNGRTHYTPEDLAFMEEEARHNPKVVAIGECGLDYHWLPSGDEELAALYGTDEHMKELQAETFSEQIRMAIRVGKPIIVHSRDAALDTYELMKREHAEQCGGVIHCFSYSPEEARRYLEMGFYIGIGGVLTFKNAAKLRRVCETVPMERILLETDCPYMAPEPHRGERNDSRYLTEVVRKMAEIKNLTTTQIVETTYMNACRMYGL